MKYIKVNKDGTITLPKEALRAFPALSELVLWWKNDALVLKKVAPTAPSEFAERVKGKAPSLKSIASEIDQVRKEK